MSGASTLSKRRPKKPSKAVSIGTAIALLFCGAFAAAVPVPHPKPKLKAVEKAAPPSSDGVTDLSHAVPLSQYLNRPSTADQYRHLSKELAEKKPVLDTARSKSETLAVEAERLQKKLVETAARVEALERETVEIDDDVVRLTAENARLSATFARDRVQVSKLLAVIERLQHDMPPAMAVRPDDALAAARSAMLIGASLPNIYHEAAALARRIEMLQRTRAALVKRRSEAVQTAAALSHARIDLDQLLAVKRIEASSAASRYGELKRRLDTIATQAVSLQVLLQKVAQLNYASSAQSVVTVNAVRSDRQKAGGAWLLPPVVGVSRAGGVDGVGGSTAPGITYTTRPSATVIAPADGKIIFAGLMPKSGRVLILKSGDVYHVVLAGLDRLDVHPGNDVLAGEPVGIMSKFDHEPRLYFELRQNGKGMSPAPYIAIPLRKAR